MESKTYPVVMIGAGPSALSAAVYTTREEIDTLLIEKGAIGGLAAITDWVDNYPGFAKGISGMELAEQLRMQAERFGAQFELGEVTAIEDQGDMKLLKTTSGDISAQAVLIATGSDYKKLKIPGEEEYYGRGVHYCATCDGAFYKDKRLVVVGSGNSAAQEALFLTRFAADIQVLIRGDKWKASEVLQRKLEAEPRIKTRFNFVSEEVIGSSADGVSAIKGKDTTSGETVEIETDGIFVFVGLMPNTQFLKDTPIELDELGFIKTDAHLMTSMKGVFASGDVRSGATMQIASAVGEGATAALKIREFLED